MVVSNNFVIDDDFRLTPLGEPPSPRAAHVATAVGTMVVIQVLAALIGLVVMWLVT